MTLNLPGDQTPRRARATPDELQHPARSVLFASGMPVSLTHSIDGLEHFVCNFSSVLSLEVPLEPNRAAILNQDLNLFS